MQSLLNHSITSSPHSSNDLFIFLWAVSSLHYTTRIQRVIYHGMLCSLLSPYDHLFESVMTVGNSTPHSWYCRSSTVMINMSSWRYRLMWGMMRDQHPLIKCGFGTISLVWITNICRCTSSRINISSQTWDVQPYLSRNWMDVHRNQMYIETNK